MTSSRTKWLLVTAAAWNIVGGAGALLDPAGHFAQFYWQPMPLTDPMQLFFYRCTWINVIAWGIAYALAAMLPAAREAVLAAGAAGKTLFFGACVSLYLAGAAKGLMLAAGVVDLVLAVLFVVVVMAEHRRTHPVALSAKTH